MGDDEYSKEAAAAILSIVHEKFPQLKHWDRKPRTTTSQREDDNSNKQVRVCCLWRIVIVELEKRCAE